MENLFRIVNSRMAREDLIDQNHQMPENCRKMHDPHRPLQLREPCSCYYGDTDPEGGASGRPANAGFHGQPFRPQKPGIKGIADIDPTRQPINGAAFLLPLQSPRYVPEVIAFP